LRDTLNSKIYSNVNKDTINRQQIELEKSAMKK